MKTFLCAAYHVSGIVVLYVEKTKFWLKMRVLKQRGMFLAFECSIYRNLVNDFGEIWDDKS